MSMTTALKKQIQKMARESVREALREEIPFIELVLSPSTRNRLQIMRDFKATKHYSPAFLKSMEKGLARSKYFK